ncbi:hypothetical protein ACFL00_03000 [Pseudomonadota bacterium]
MLLARKWSPYFDPGLAVLNSWPIHVYPPGFPWILAISGASKTLYTAHLFVSICFLASVMVFGYLAREELGALQGGLLTLAMCLLPGVILSSLGILSENLYLFSSLSVLLLYSKIKADVHTSVVWILALVILLTLTILTRSIGIALVLAVATAPIFDKNLQKKQKIIFLGTGVVSIVVWQVWGVIQPQPTGPTYFGTLQSATQNLTDIPSLAVAFWSVVKTNLVQIISSFNHYLSLTNINVWFFLCSFMLLLFCLISLGLRFYQFKVDAVYLVFYLAILTIWPFPEEMTRFLHPIIFLLILQPTAYFNKGILNQKRTRAQWVVMLATGVFVINSLYLQFLLVQKRNIAEVNNPILVHSFHYYDEPSKFLGELWSTFYAGTTRAIVESPKHILSDDVVAAVKHENFVILTNRQAIPLSAVVPHNQQLCNLKLMNADVIFLSQMTTANNERTLTLMEDYQNILSDVWTLKDENGVVWAQVLYIDKLKLDEELNSHECLSVQLIP